jgi:hypothetical protein
MRRVSAERVRCYFLIAGAIVSGGRTQYLERSSQWLEQSHFGGLPGACWKLKHSLMSSACAMRWFKAGKPNVPAQNLSRLTCLSDREQP